MPVFYLLHACQYLGSFEFECIATGWQTWGLLPLSHNDPWPVFQHQVDSWVRSSQECLLRLRKSFRLWICKVVDSARVFKFFNLNSAVDLELEVCLGHSGWVWPSDFCCQVREGSQLGSGWASRPWFLLKILRVLSITAVQWAFLFQAQAAAAAAAFMTGSLSAPVSAAAAVLWDQVPHWSTRSLSQSDTLRLMAQSAWPNFTWPDFNIRVKVLKTSGFQGWILGRGSKSTVAVVGQH